MQPTGLVRTEFLLMGCASPASGNHSLLDSKPGQRKVALISGRGERASRGKGSAKVSKPNVRDEWEPSLIPLVAPQLPKLLTN